MSKLNVKSMKKSTLDHLITFAMVIVAYLIVQILIAAGVLSSLMQGLLVPMCTYSIVAIGLNLCVGYLGELSIGHAGFMCVGAFSSAFARIMHISTDEILISLPSTNLISQLIPDFSKRCAYAVNIRFAVSF